eukprot:4587624-Amphidinium_carterae.2
MVSLRVSSSQPRSKLPTQPIARACEVYTGDVDTLLWADLSTHHESRTEKGAHLRRLSILGCTRGT